MDTVLQDHSNWKLRNQIKNWLVDNVHSQESIYMWLNGDRMVSKRILGNGSKPGFKRYLTHNYSKGTGYVLIPTRAALALGDLELKVEDEIVFSWPKDKNWSPFFSFQLVVRVLEIEETDIFMPLVQLKGGAMCRSSKPLNN